MHKVCRSYEFHSESAERQNEACKQQIATLKEKEILLWLDWKQNLTLPLAAVQTNEQFWAHSRKEVSCLGCVAYVGRTGAEPKRICLVYLSEIIEHTCLAACLQIDKMLQSLGGLSKYNSVKLWFDCGPHYRTLDLAAHIAEKHVRPQNRNNLILSINYFTEKHGKGQVDSLFSCCNRWIKSSLMKPDTLLMSVEQLRDAFVAGAAHDMKQSPPDKGGTKYIIAFWDSQAKPATYFKGSSETLQIKKTYSIEMQHFGSNNARLLRFRNMFFSDCGRAKSEVFYLDVETVNIPADERSWRKGFFGNTRWQKAFPDPNIRNTMISRMTALEGHAAEEVVRSTLFERRLSRYLQQLQQSKEKRQRQRDAVRSNSSSSSSSEDTESSSSDE
ncbi:unnamed protein product [Durusdinium trenchii]|uniref:Uncharacterized protein n=2 Tax=Durusdinium trenchii TaxID=1381693 RepID=A0ABP0JUT1_9DINO